MSEERTARNHCFGYARVSTDDQNLSLQIGALVRHDIDARNIFTDKISGAKEDRPGLSKCLATLPPCGPETRLSYGDLIVLDDRCVTS